MKSQRMQEEYEKQLHDMEESKNQALEELTEYYEAKLHEKSALLEEVIITYMAWTAGHILFLFFSARGGLSSAHEDLNPTCSLTTEKASSLCHKFWSVHKRPCP